MAYANFWKRTAAYLIDGIIYGVASSIIGNIVGLIIGICFGITASAGQQDPSLTMLLAGAGLAIGVQITCFLLYFVWPESSAWQATIGKKILGLQVTDINGQRISFMRSLGRNVAMIISTLILCIGYLMCLWTPKKQCLHDSLADCLVIDTKPNEKQGCVVGAIIGFFVLLIMVFVGGIIAAIALPQYVRAVEKARITQTQVLLKQMGAAQGRYQHKHNLPASFWDQLDQSFDCKIQGDRRLCVGKDYTYTLSPQVITATRLNKDSKAYTLSFYPNGKFTCEGQNDWGRSLCQLVTP